jgi:sugar phosphate isomerase/epimerase
MKLGISSYSLSGAMKANQIDIIQAMEWAKEHGSEHVEIVPGHGFDIEETGLIERIKDKAAELGLALSNYAIGGNFIASSREEYELEIKKLYRHVDIAYQLGINKMRHDVAWLPPEDATIVRFEKDIERLVSGCRAIADYASQYGITTSIENHGYHVQASDRVLRLYHEVNRPNFKITVDIGNFMCADEDSLAAVKKVMPYASMLHLKDFYLRSSAHNPGEGFFPTISGNYLRGAIVGQGDVNLREILKVVKSSGYDGYASIEFEGMEESRRGTSISLENARRVWTEL